MSLKATPLLPSQLVPGKRGRKPTPPHKMFTCRLALPQRSAMVDFCVVNDITQRKFLEDAIDLLLMQRRLATRRERSAAKVLL